MLQSRVLFILHYPPPVHGAAVVGQYIRESKHINNNFNCKYLKLGTAQTLSDIGKSSVLKIIRYISLIVNTVYSIIRFRPQLVYMTLTAKGSGFYKDALIVLIVKILGRQLVYHFHNKGVSERQNKRLDNLLYNIVFTNANVILLSEYLYKDIQKYVPKSRVHICYNGILEIKFNDNQKKLHSNKNETQILFISNLMRTKGVFVLLKACKLLKEGGLIFHCNFIGAEGDISSAKIKNKIRELGIDDVTSYLGPKYNKEKAIVLDSSDIFAFPTFYPRECFPLVLLEAMQFALPVVSTYEGGIPDIVKDGETGFLVNKKNEPELADKLELLISDKELCKRMGEAGRKRYLDHFTIDYFEERFTKILDTIINKN